MMQNERNTNWRKRLLCGVVISGKKNARQFKASMKEEEFTTQMLIHDITDRRMLAKVVMALVEEVTEKSDPVPAKEDEDEQFIKELVLHPVRNHTVSVVSGWMEY